MINNLNGAENTATGANALVNNTDGTGNTADGFVAGYDNTTGSYNTFLGYNSGRGIVDGSNNTIVGANVNGASNLSNNIILGDGGGNIRAQHDGTNWTLTGGLIASGLRYPTFDGTPNQVLSTDGSGNMAWSNSFSKDLLISPLFNNVAIGYVAGTGGQGDHSIAIGSNVAQGAQAERAVAIGYAAGQYDQGLNSVAIGSFAGNNNQAANSIVLNATGNSLNAPTTGLFIDPIRSSINDKVLYYNETTKEITYGAATASIMEVADEFSASAAQTDFTLTQPPSANSKVKMYINGIRISNTAYSISGNTLSYTAASNGGYIISNNDRLQFDYYY